MEFFSLDQFLIIDSQRMRKEPEKVLIDIEKFLGVSPFSYEISTSKHANSALARRPITSIGRALRVLFSFIPRIIKSPIVIILQKRDIDIYRSPVISRRADTISVTLDHYSICAPTISSDLKNFQLLTNFDTSTWLELLPPNYE